MGTDRVKTRSHANEPYIVPFNVTIEPINISERGHGLVLGSRRSVLGSWREMTVFPLTGTWDRVILLKDLGLRITQP